MAQVLVVDDDQATRETLRVLLEDEGYSVTEAACGHEALALLRACHEALVVLLDLHMPDGDGVWLLEAVQADAELARRHRYLVMTALPPHAIDLPDGLCRLLAAPLIEKPFDLEQIVEVVAQATQCLLAVVDGHPAAW